MTTTIIDIENARSFEIEGDNPGSPGSVFISGPRGWCMELDRATFLQAVADEFGLVDPLEAALHS